MKRSIVCLSVLILVISIGVGTEIIYSKTLSGKLEDTIEVCRSTDDFEIRSSACDKMNEYFKSHKALNNIFFTREFTERIAKEISELSIYAKEKERLSFESGLNRLEIYVDDMLF